MIVPRSLILLPFLLLLLGPLPCRGEPEAPAGPARQFWALVAGVTTAVVPLAAGGALLGGDRTRERRLLGIDVIETGLVLGPVVSHAIDGEGEHAVFFGLPAVAVAGGMRGLTALAPDIVEESTTEARVAYFVLLSASVAAAAAGFIDSALYGVRHRPRVHLAPALGGGRAGLVIGGTL